jgi:hypothetical protein
MRYKDITRKFPKERIDLITNVLLEAFGPNPKKFIENVKAGGPGDSYQGEVIDWKDVNKEERQQLRIAVGELLQEEQCVLS